MATTEGIGAAIEVDPQIEAQLKRVQGTIDKMAISAEKLANGFSSFMGRAGEFMNSTERGGASVATGFEKAASATQRLKDACGETSREIEKIVSSAQKLESTKSVILDIQNSFHDNSGKTFTGISKVGREDWFIKELEERRKYYRDLYKELEEKEASLRTAIAHYDYGSDNYTEANRQLTKYRSEMEKIRQIMKSFKEDRPDFSINNYEEDDSAAYEKYWSDKQRILEAGMEWEKQAKNKLYRLEDEATKAKFEAEKAYIDWWHDALDEKERKEEEAAQKSIALLEKEAEAKRKAEEAVLARQTKQADSLLSKFNVALEMPEDDINQVKDKIGQLKAAYITLSKAQTNNPLITDANIRDAKEKLEYYRNMLDEMMQKQNVAKKKSNVVFSIGLDQSNIEALQRKISAVRSNLNDLKRTAGGRLEQSFIKQAEGDLTKLEVRLKASRFALRQTSQAASAMGDMLKRAFSFALVTNFVRQVVQVRGEFEMAEKSIGVIIKDANKAKEIFGEIQKIAVISPFQVKDLVKQTKQLAAYRIETDKLVETTKMLGDISAGVGVDMNRLILAYGQVKATTYLKGTELRQFSEAGVNMLGGLADRFSEIENRAVSTGEVLQRISNKMVSFEDVDAVLRAQVSMGGAFYKMQEQQAQTLQGRVSNLRDRIDIMFNEVGKQEQGIISTAISFIEFFVEHYQALQAMLTAGTIYYAAVRVLSPLTKIKKLMVSIRALAAMAKADGLISFVTSLGAAAPVIGAILAAVAGLIAGVRSLTKLTRDLRKEAKKAQDETDNQIDSLNILMSKISDTNRSMSDRNKAFEELKSKFGNIIPLENENVDTISRGTDKYREYADAIRESNSELLREKLILTTIDDTEKRYERRARRLSRDLSGIKGWTEDLDKSNVSESLLLETRNKTYAGEFNDAQSAMEYFFNSLDEYYGRAKGYTLENIMSGYANRKNDVLRTFDKMFNELDNKIERIGNKWTNIFSYGENGQELGRQIRDFSKSVEEKTNKAIDELKEKYKETGATQPFVIDDATLKNITYEEANKYAKYLEEQIDNALKKEEGGISKIHADNLKKDLKNALGEKSLSELDKAINDFYIEINKKFTGLGTKMGSGEFARNSGERIDDFIKRLEIARQKAENISSKFTGNKYQDALSTSAFGMNQEQASQTKDALTLLIEFLKQYSSESSKASREADKSAKDTESALKSLVSEVLKADDAFKELNDEGDKLFKDQLSSLANKAHVSLPDNFGEDAIKAWLESIKKSLGNEEFTEALLTLNKDIASKKMEENSKEIARMWENYQNAKSLEGMGISFSGIGSSASYLAELKRMEDEYRKDDSTIKLAEEIKQKRLDIIRSEQDEAAKLIYEGQKKSASKVEQIYQEMFENIGKIRSKANGGDGAIIDEKSISSGINGQVAKAMKDIADAEWEAYKATEMYAMAFGDLEGLGVDVLQRLRDQLVKFKESNALAPTEIKTITRAINELNIKIEQVKGAKFGDVISSGFRQIREAAEEFRSKVPTLTQDFLVTSAQVESAQEEYDAMKKLAEQMPENEEIALKLEIAYALLAAAQELNSQATSKMSDAQKEALAKIKAAKKNLNTVNDALNALSSTVSSSIGLFNDLTDAFGIAVSDDTNAAIEGFQKGFALIGSAVGIAITAITSYSVLVNAGIINTAILEGMIWPLLAAAVALGAIIAIIKAKDNSLAESVEYHKEAVERLQKAYDKLSTSMNEALDTKKASAYHQEMIVNLQKQRKEIEEAISLERQRKQTDEVKESIKELEDQLSDLDESQKQLANDWMELMGATSDWSGLARDWAADWLDAFKNAENGVDSLKNSFDDLWDSIVAKQLSNELKSYIENISTYLTNALGDGIITDVEAATIAAMKQQLAEANAALQKKAQYLGVTQTGEASEDTLQRGIESVTEQTAQALESILNSTRSYVADNNRILLAIEQSMIIGEGENTILSNIKSQTRYLKSISEIANAVYYPGSHTKGAGGLKVFVD